MHGEREPIMGLGLSIMGSGALPQWGPGVKPLVRGLCPPEADEFLANDTYFAIMTFIARLHTKCYTVLLNYVIFQS